MNRITKTLYSILLLTALFGSLVSCNKSSKGPDPLSVAVFVPGIVSGSPIYEMLVDGAQKAVSEVKDARLKIIEAGFDQSTWQETLRDIAASNEFGIIISSNPSLPELCDKISKDYSAVKFIIADSYLKGKPSIHTVLYNQKEQGYIVGYLAGLKTKNLMPEDKPVAGMVVAQHYPTLDRLIIPGFEAGLKAVDPEFTLLIREIGNWFDTAKAAELASALFSEGVKVILPIAGSAGQGVVSAAKERGCNVVWFDGDGYSMDPDTVIGCATLAQDKLVYGQLKAALLGDTSIYGRADIASIRDGYIDFDPDGPGYRTLPHEIRSNFEAALASLKNGNPDFSMDSF